MSRLIINADDFGLTASCTQAIAQSLRDGLVTDTTMVANGEAFEQAAQLAVREFAGKVGIHFNLTEGRPLTQDIRELAAFCADGAFHGKINRLKRLDRREKQAVYDELNAQCRKLKDASIEITHADSHHHIHTGIFIAPIVMRVCRENAIEAIRLHRNMGQISTVKRMVKYLYNMAQRRRFKTTDYMGSADDVSLATPITGTVEIMVHPDIDIHGNIIDRREDGGPLLSTLNYWPDAVKINYRQLR